MSRGDDNALKTRVSIRWMLRKDMKEVLAIEADSFNHPWSEEEFLRALRQRNCIGMVAEHGDEVLGFMIYELHRSKIQVLNFAVRRDRRHHRVGLQMFQKMVGKLSIQRRNRIEIIVRETNLTAQLFFRDSAGMLATEVMREHFRDTGEDGYLFRYSLAAADLTENAKAALAVADDPTCPSL
jgi:[ribosomal protein S18]-alanine N-acetyltransferase